MAEARAAAEPFAVPHGFPERQPTAALQYRAHEPDRRRYPVRPTCGGAWCIWTSCSRSSASPPPGRSKEMKPVINARAEKVADKPYFRGAFKTTRCLVPADGWYEWIVIVGKKVPHAIRKPDWSTFFFAGLYSQVVKPDGVGEYTFCIITTESSADLRWVHDRMLVVLPNDEGIWAKWLDPDTPRAELLAMLIPAPVGTFDARPANLRVNNPRNEGPELLEP